MKTAVIVAGVCRFTDISHKSWTMFPEADWYLSTWDISQQPYSKKATKSNKEIKNIEHLFKTIIVSNYQKEFLDHSYIAPERPFILLEKIFNIIKDLGYKRIIYFRPDLMLYTTDNFSHIDFNINDNYINLLDIHTPDLTIRYKEKTVSDLFFVFSWNNFTKFLTARKEILNQADIHKIIYKFFIDNHIEMNAMINMRSIILRNNVYEHLDNLSWDNLYNLFHDVFKDHGSGKSNKFPHEIEISTIADQELINKSRSTGGILKSRK